MNIHLAKIATTGFFFLSIVSVCSAVAESPSGPFEKFEIEIQDIGNLLESKPPVPRRFPRYLKLSEKLRVLDRPVITRTDGKSYRLPLMLNFKVSKNRKTVVQFGDPLFRMHPVRTDLFWIDENGEVRTKIGRASCRVRV